MKKLIAGLIMAVGLIGTVQAQGDPEAGKSLAATCAACHGQDGAKPIAPNYPKIAGLGEKYLFKQLQDIKTGARKVPAMMGIVAPLSEQDLADLAAYFSTLEMGVGQADPELVDKGRELYRGGNLASGVPACTACHGPQGKGVPSAGFPQVGGQQATYLAEELKAFQAGERSNGPNGMMQDIASKLTEAEIEAVSSYMSGLH